MSFLDYAKKRKIQKWIEAGGKSTTFNPRDFKKQIKELKINLGPIFARGQYTDLYKPLALGLIYGRKNLCLKVFKAGTDTWGSDLVMGVSNIIESTMVQNLLALKGKSPRVYDLVKVQGKFGQVLEFLKGRPGGAKIEDERFVFHTPEVTQPHNLIEGKLVDLQGAKFKDFGEFKRCLIGQATGKVQSRGASGGAYQSTAYFPGFRETQERLDRYQITDYEGKLVLDIGCNYGMFCRDACNKGAKRVVGLDTPEIVNIAAKLAIIDGYFNIDFIGCDISQMTSKRLEEQTGIAKFDIHLFLSMVNWVGEPKFIFNCTKMYREDHGANRNYRVIEFNKK